MADIGGYAGKILRVDLSTERVWSEDLDEATARKWLGGIGLGAKILYDEVPAGVEWDDPENRLIIGGGPLAGTRVVGSGTITVTTKGPMTNGATSTQANGYLGAFMKFSGFDAIAIQGQARRWLYLHIHDDTAELREASHLLGKDTWETDDAIKEELGARERGASVFSIGPAGEHLAKLAAVAGDKGHVAGHNGTGAVMGSKRLKAIVAMRGRGRVEVDDNPNLTKIARDWFATFDENPLAGHVKQWGTLGFFEQIESTGGLPVKNYTTDIFPDREKIQDFSAENIRGTFSPERKPCWACQMVHCHEYTIPEGRWKGRQADEPEYEGLASWGPVTGQTDVNNAVFLASEVDRLGLETNGTGWTVSLAMELYESEVITKQDTDGLELTWGNADAVYQLLHKIARRDGFGDVLADGAKAAAERIGGEALEMGIYTAKGGVPRSHDHRAMWAEMFETATSSTGTIEAGRGMDPEDAGLAAPDNPEDVLASVGDPFSPDDVVRLLSATRGGKHFEDSMGTCTFTTLGDVRKIAQLLSVATGWDFTFEEAMQAGERTANLLRAFNMRHGLTAELDLQGPSERYGSAPTDGPVEGVTIRPHWEQMVHNFYEQNGWDRDTGKPLPETLRAVGLEHVVPDLWEAEPAV